MPVIDKASLARLRGAIRESSDAMQPFRRNRQKFLKEFVGSNYAPHGADRAVPQNFLELFATTVLRHLVAKNPAVLLNPKKEALLAASRRIEPYLNTVIQRMDLQATFRDWAMEAMFSPVGVLLLGPNQRIGVDPVTGEAMFGLAADPIGFDDLVIDMGAKRWGDITYIGNVYEAPLEAAKKSDLLSRSARKTLKESPRLRGIEDREDNSYRISRDGRRDDRYQFEQYTNLMQVFLPEYQVVLTLPADDSDVILAESEWKGPQSGPYHPLTFIDVPGQLMALSPMANLFDLHSFLNQICRKIMGQARDQKTVLGYRAGKAQDAQRIKNASDLELIAMVDEGAVREYKFGGNDPALTALTMMVRDWLDYYGGNVSALAGLGPQSETASQDQMLLQSASKRVSDMQDRLLKAGRGVIRDLVYYVWADQDLNDTVPLKIPGLSRPLDVPITHDNLPPLGEFEIDMDVYAMQDETPATRLNKLNGVMQNYVLPLMPQIEAQGGSVDIAVLFDELGRLLRMPELQTMVKFRRAQAQSVPMGGQGGNATARPATTHRVTTRVNRPGTTRQGKEQALVASLLGQKRQPAEQAAAMRNVG